ncbi:hypothetical protein [Halostella pelagica]|uniref:hypothetical protein n=1 Tax=Halostella pelagica TaxID=2583824 RepID=UPI0010809865|nr:hypothetical protein [Halostella pelagica]
MTEIFVEPDATAERIRDYVRDHPEVRHEDYRNHSNPVRESCYVLAEAYFHAKGGTDRFDVYRLDWGEVSADGTGAHWFLRDTDAAGDTVIDLSLPAPADGDSVPWDAARHRAFITGYEPSNRAKSVLDALDLEY